MAHVLLGPEGPGRRRLVQRRAATLAASGGSVWFADARLSTAGVWGPVASWLRSLLPEIEARTPSLLETYSRELEVLLPERADTGPRPAKNLTELAQGSERIRMFPADRVFRTVHGIVELLGLALADRPGPHVIAWDGYDASSRLSRRVLHELVRRHRETLDLVLVLTGDSTQRGALTEELEALCGARPEMTEHGLEAETGDRPLSTHDAAARAEAIAARLTGGATNDEPLLFSLIDLWEHAGDRQKSLEARARAVAVLNRLAYYEDALPLARSVIDEISAIRDEPTRLGLLLSTYGVFIATGHPDEALAVLSPWQFETFEDEGVSPSIHYMLAMLHLRYLPDRDPDRAAAHLTTALELQDSSEASGSEGRLQRAFLRNGMALVYFRQGRIEQARAECLANLADLEDEFEAGEHLLFQSVLHHNLAMLYVAEERFDAAHDEYGRAIALDPNYSDYYNERGGVSLRRDRPEEALSDFRKAVEIGPPYAESWTNLGQAYRQLGAVEDAVSAYSKAIELAPELLLARLGRAQCHRLREDHDAAMVDYTVALELDPEQPLVWANRATLNCMAQRFDDALADLDQAIARAPDNVELQHNRAWVVQTRERSASAAGG